jgi:hypothetical protein
MRSLRAGAIACAAIGAITAVSADAAKAPIRDSNGKPVRTVTASVVPAAGTPDTRFVVRFKARNDARGKVFYDIEATGPEPAHFGDCDNDTAIFRHAHRGDEVRVHIPSRRTKPDWCAGHYDGTVFLEDDRRGPGRERDKVVGSFSFEVRASSARAPRSAPPAGTGASDTASRAAR